MGFIVKCDEVLDPDAPEKPGGRSKERPASLSVSGLEAAPLDSQVKIRLGSSGVRVSKTELQTRTVVTLSRPAGVVVRARSGDLSGGPLPEDYAPFERQYYDDQPQMPVMEPPPPVEPVEPYEPGKERRNDIVHILPEYMDRRDRRKHEDLPEDVEADRRSLTGRTDRRRSRRRVAGKNTLTVSNLRKNFGRKEIVRGVGFSMTGGEVAGLLGPNGAGKTTIFYMIVGFLKPTTGDIKLNDKSIVHGPMYRRARMGVAYLPQEPSVFRKLTVEENIWAILESRNDITKKQKKERLDQLIEDFSIGRIRKQLGYTLSGGERRRTEIARSLAIEPKFLLLDEPFAGIDPIAVYEIKQIIRKLSQEGIGVLITDHNVRDTLEITTDAFIINQGLIVARGDKNSILSNQTVRDVYLGSEFRM